MISEDGISFSGSIRECIVYDGRDYADTGILKFVPTTTHVNFSV